MAQHATLAGRPVTTATATTWAPLAELETVTAERDALQAMVERLETEVAALRVKLAEGAVAAD